MLSFYFLLPPVLYLQISYNLQSSTFSEIEKLIRKLVSLLLHLESCSCGFDRASQEAQVDALFVFVYFYVGKILILWWVERALADADEFIGSLCHFPRWQIRSSFQEMFSFLEIQVDKPTVKSEKTWPCIVQCIKNAEHLLHFSVGNPPPFLCSKMCHTNTSIVPEMAALLTL